MAPLRFQSLGSTAFCVAALSTSLKSEQVAVSEIMYNPPAGKFEYVEIQNLTATPFDIALWRLRDGADFDFPDFSAGNPQNTFLKAFERIVICETDPATFRAAYGIPGAIRVFGPWTGNLDNSGERVTLKDKNGVTRCTVRYNDKDRWPVAADGAGHSLILVDDTREIDDYRLWAASPSPGGTPGSSDPASAEEPYANPEVNLSIGIPYINFGDAWDLHDTGADLGTTWKDVAYTYSHPGWKLIGAAGNNGGLYGFETAALPAPGIQTATTNAAQLTYYFRKSFTYNGPTTGVTLTIDMINDDGAGFWLNGAWVGGRGTVAGATHTAVATRNVSDATEEAAVVSVSTAPLVNGVNVIAAAGKQHRTGSSDFVFGARVSISAPNTPSVVINEVQPAAAGKGFVEFYNPTAAEINIGGWYLSDTPGNLTKFQIPGSLILPASGLASVGFTESSLAIASQTVVYLTGSNGTTVANAINSSMPLDGRSLGRKPEGSGSWFLFSSSTRDAPNASSGGLGKFLTINEVHFDPTAGTADWVELHNIGASSVSTNGLFLSSMPDLSDKIPLSGSVGAKGFASWNTAFPASGNEIQFFISNASNAIIAANAIPLASGRAQTAAFPDGSGAFYVSATGSRDAANNPSRNTSIVINEIMVEPLSGHRDGEFIELFNKGAAAVSLTRWAIEEGVSYTFPPGTSLAPGGFLVIAANPALTSTAFPGATVIGPYEGSLSNSGEYFRIADEWGNTVDEVHYHTGGDWPLLAAGRGSSLELRHPDMDNAKPSAWQASNESSKAIWRTFTFTDQYLQLNSQGNTTDYKELHIFAIGDAHIALRNVTLTRAGSGNLLPGGGTTVSHTGNGTEGWLCQGTHHASDTVGGEFHVISSGHGDNKANRCEIDVIGMNQNDTLTFTCEARWISGKPTLVVNTWDRSCGEVIDIPVPPNLGSAGVANSALLGAPAPAVSELRHSPPVPTSSVPVVVTARVTSANPITSVNLHHRADSGTANTGAYTVTAMNDMGTGGDLVAGDGIYSVSMTQYQSDNQIVQFYVRADSAGGASIVPGQAPVWPAMWVVDNSGIPTDLRTQRFVISAYDVNSLNTGTGQSAARDFDFPRLSNQYFNATFISDEQDIIYNCELRKSGSPWTRTDAADVSKGKWKSPSDKRFRGYTKRAMDNDAGGGAAYHNRIIRHWLYLFGHAANENEFVRVIVNGGEAALREDVEPNANDFLKRNWDDGEQGELYRIDDEWWFTDGWDRGQRDADWSFKGTHEPERYHSEWVKRSRETEYDYASLTTWMEKVGGNSFTREEIERMADIDMMAANAVVRGWCDDWDTLTRSRGKNGYFLRRHGDGKFMLIQWDSDLTFGGAGSEFIGGLAGVRNFFDKPYVRQRVNHYIGKMINDFAATGPRMQAWFDFEEGASSSYGANETTYTSWHNNRVPRAQSEIGAALNALFDVTTGNGSSVTTATDAITLAGTSGWETFVVRVVGHPEGIVSFSTQTAWTLAGIQLRQGANPLTVEALDYAGKVIASELFTVTKTGNALPVLNIVSDPGSWNVARGQSLMMDSSTSYDPEGTPLTFAWGVSPVTGNLFTGATSPAALATFSAPGIYTFTLTGTDGAAAKRSVSRDASVYAASGWSSFSHQVLESYWRPQNLEVRDGDSPIASYTLDDRPGKLVLKVEDAQARPLTMTAPSHPALWRPLPSATDWSIQTDVELDSLQQGDFTVGMIVELVETGTTVRYAFGIEDGDFLRVKRATGGAYSDLATLSWVTDVATVRVRRFGNQLLFDRQGKAGEWINSHTRAVAAGSTATKGGIFAANDIARNARFEFDYFMLIDPNTTSNHLAGLRITEILYNDSPGSELEFIELTNTGGVPIDLAGVSFDAGLPFDALVLPSFILQPGASGILTNDSAAFVARFGSGPVIIAQWPGGRLSNNGERIVLRDPDGNVIHDFSYDDDPPWPQAADGTGNNLQVVDTDRNYADPANWLSSETTGGSPGFYEFSLKWHGMALNPGNGTVTLRWVSRPLRNYVVEYSGNLAQWFPLATVSASGTGITSYTDTTATQRRHYRVTIVP